LARLRILSDKEVCRILEQNGFIEVKRHGSHVVMPCTGRVADLFGLFAVNGPFLAVLARDAKVEALAAERQEKFLLSAVS